MEDKEQISADKLLNDIENLIAKKGNLLKSNGIDISNKTISGSLSINLNFPFNFENCIFQNNFSFFGNKISEDINFRRCDFTRDISFIDFTALKRITFLDCNIQGQFVISAEINKLLCYSTPINDLIINSSTISEIELGGKELSRLNSVSILNANKISKIQFANLEIRKINFSVLANETEIFNCSLNSICLNKVRNSGNLKLLNCKSLSISNKMSHFIITESNLGKAEFFQFDFSSFDEVNIINSVLNECLFVNTTWANNIKTYAGDQMDLYLKDRISIRQGKKIDNTETIHQLKNKREVYKQIKYALSKQGDYVNEQLFHTLEMNTYNKILPWTYNNISTKTILYLSSVTSLYGQSLLRPVIFLVLINSILISLINFDNNLHFIPIEQISFKDILKPTSQLFWYSNPFHKAEEFKGIQIILDTLIRIVSSYSIYNIIRATRRFIK